MKKVQLKMFKKTETAEQNFNLSVDEMTEDQATALLTNMFSAFGVESPMHIMRIEPMPLQYHPGYRMMMDEAAATACADEECDCHTESWHPYAAPLRPLSAEPMHTGPVERETPEGHRMVDDIVFMKPEAKPSHDAAEVKHEAPQSRQLPIKDHEQRSSFSLADNPAAAKLLEAAKSIVEQTPKAQPHIDERPAHVVTGIKVIDEGGMPVQTFRARCNCPNCGWRGNRYIRRDNTWAKCYNCNIKIAVIPATSQPMVPDAFNNFFVGDKEYME